MARESGVAYHQSRHKQGNSRIGKQLNVCETAEAEESSFCLAWFAPSGIQTMAVSTNNEADDDDDDKDNQTQQSNGRGEKKNNTGNNVVCCPEWRGYRHATEVLFPFGYTTWFIRVRAIECSNIKVLESNLHINNQNCCLHLNRMSWMHR